MSEEKVLDNKIISYIRFTNDDKKYELCDFKSKIIPHTIYEIELFETKWIYAEISKIINIFLISDLIPIVFEYSLDSQKLMIMKEICTRANPDIYFLTDTAVYNFYSGISLPYNFFLKIIPCKVAYENIMQRQCFCSDTAPCVCRRKCTPISANGDIRDNIIYCKDFSDNEWNSICLMYKIFKFFSQKN